MSNTFTNPTIVAKEALRQLENNCVMGNLVYRAYESEWAKTHNGYKPGATITVDAPMYARVEDGADITSTTRDMLSRTTTMTLAFRKNVSHALTSAEMTYSIDKFNEKITKPACVALGNYVDSVLLSCYKGVANQVGSPGSTPKDYLNFALAGARLTDQAVPPDNRHCVVNPTAMAYISDGLKGIFNQEMAANIVKASYRGNLAGFNMYESQNVNNHTCGTAAGLTTPLIYGTVSEGATTLPIDTNGTWTLTLTEGDIFTVDGTYAVNPISGSKLPYLRQFVCSNGTLGADTAVHVDNGTDATLYTIPGTAPWKIYSQAAAATYLPYQTINTLPADNAHLNIAGTASEVYPVNLAFHRDCIALAMVPLEMPPSVAWKAQMSQNGYSIRVIRDYDVKLDTEYIRFDVLFGIKVINPFFGCRIAG